MPYRKNSKSNLLTEELNSTQTLACLLASKKYFLSSLDIKE